jgi:uncharacterized protein
MQKLTALDKAAVAFSGGADSTFLAAAAKKALGDNVIALTACSETFTQAEEEECIMLAQKIGIVQMFLKSSELLNPDFLANTPQKCYFCKKERFAAIRSFADERSIPWILEGSNSDDENDYRPGMRALKETKGVISPLLEAGFTKKDIREISKDWGLPTFDKPSDSCLATRLSYGLPITKERLNQVREAELFLKKFCSGTIRVRHHGNLARIEAAPSEITRITSLDIASQINDYLKSLGFLYVTVDLAGYRQGSMNEELKNGQ